MGVTKYVVVAIISAGVLSGCNGDGENAATSTSSTVAQSFNARDVTFAQMMIPHHQQAVQMAGLVDGRSTNENIKALAAQISQAQDPEIRSMQGWLRAWKQPETPPMAHDMGHGGMASAADLEALTKATGSDFDAKFLALMTAHHAGAIAMAEEETRTGTNASATTLAQQIITAQQSEIATMQELSGDAAAN